MILVDTNVLTRMTRKNDPQCAVAREATQNLSDLWLALVEGHGVTGFRAHDVRLVAAMQTYGITRILTFNAGHFCDLPITVLEPAQV